MTGIVVLLNNAGADSGVDIIGEWKTWFGGPGDFWVWGDLGGGVIELQASINETAPVSVCDTQVTAITPTASGLTVFHLKHGTRLRAVVTGATSPSSGIFAKVN